MVFPGFPKNSKDNSHNTSLLFISIFYDALMNRQIFNDKNILYTDFMYRRSYRRCSIKQEFLKISQKFTVRHSCRSLFVNKVTGLMPPTQVFSCEFCEIFENNFYTERSRRLPLYILLEAFHTEALHNVRFLDSKHTTLPTYYQLLH